MSAYLTSLRLKRLGCMPPIVLAPRHRQCALRRFSCATLSSKSTEEKKDCSRAHSRSHCSPPFPRPRCEQAALSFFHKRFHIMARSLPQPVTAGHAYCMFAQERLGFCFSLRRTSTIAFVKSSHHALGELARHLFHASSP